MNLGMATSYIIAGILLISITTMTLSLNKSSAELTIQQTKKEHLAAVTEMLSYEIPKIGYDRMQVTNPMITVADSHRIQFNANIDNAGAVETMEWIYTTTEVTATDNPNDYILRRIQDGNATDITLGVTKFIINYYSDYGSDVPMATPVTGTNLDDIKQVEIEIVMQSKEQILNTLGETGRYATTSWKKRFSPINLRDN